MFVWFNITSLEFISVIMNLHMVFESPYCSIHTLHLYSASVGPFPWGSCCITVPPGVARAAYCLSAPALLELPLGGGCPAWTCASRPTGQVRGRAGLGGQ